MAIESSVLFAFGAMLCWGVADFLIHRATRKLGSAESLAVIGFTGAVGLFPFVAGSLELVLAPQNLFLLAVMSVVGFFSAMLNFDALREGKLSVVDVVLTFELPLTVFLGIAFFQEKISLTQGTLIAAVFAGVLLVSLKKIDAGRLMRGVEKGAALAFLAAVGLAFFNFFAAQASKQVSPLHAIWFSWLLIGLASIAVVAWRGGLPGFRKSLGRHAKLAAAMGVVDTLAWLLYALALTGAYLSITTAVTESYAVIAVALGLKFNREKITRHQLLGAAIALAASISLGFIA